MNDAEIKEMSVRLAKITRGIDPIKSPHEGISLLYQALNDLRDEVYQAPAIAISAHVLLDRQRARAEMLLARVYRYIEDICQ